MKAEMAENQIFDIVENLSNMAYEQSESLQPAADQLGLELLTSEWFDRNSGAGIALEPKIRDTAFSNEVLREGINSEAIELADNRVVFLHLNEYRPAEQMPLDEVRQVIVAELKRQKARDDNIRLGKEALELLRNGDDLGRIAADWGLEVVDRGFVKRDSRELDRELLQRIFSMSKPASGLVFEGLAQGNGDYSLVELSGVVSNDWEYDAERIKALTTARAAVEYQSVLKALTSSAEVVKTPLSELQ